MPTKRTTPPLMTRHDYPAGSILSATVDALRSAKANGGVSQLYEYNTWRNMGQRCHNPSNPEYPNYGARGITVWEPWRVSFEMFLLCVGLRTPPANEIDRINNDGNYEPGNVRWATRAEQTRNHRRNHLITAFGRTMILTDWSRETGLSVSGLIGRIDVRGWDIERALSEPAHIQNKKNHLSDEQIAELLALRKQGTPYSQLAKRFGIHPMAVWVVVRKSDLAKEVGAKP